jgi:putative transposase
MSSGSRRSLIPPALRDLSLWRSPDEEAFDRDTLEVYQRRKRAVEMYASSSSYGAIQTDLSISAQEVRRLVKRCVVTASDGSIFGFAALLPGVRLEGYKRKKRVEHTLGGGSGGCAGALTMLFEQMPEVHAFIDEEFLKLGEGPHNALVSYRDLHGAFLKRLREAGLGDHEWPLNTKDCGYKSLRKYCVDLLYDNPARWIRARGGVQVARRTSVGSGTWPVIPTMRGMTTCQLDFHKVDAESIIFFETSEGARLPLPVARWHIGLLVEERWGLVLGAFIALETNPSGDSVLEVVESALRPAEVTNDGVFCSLTVDGKVLPNQILSELGYLGFSVLKMDNAWSNASTGVVDNIIRTVGCAINYGPVRAWWRRALIELIFGHLTRRGLQRLPSTVGAGPTDPVKNDPVGHAKKFEITIRDLVDIVFACIRERNETRSERIGFATPMSALLSCMNKSGSPVFSQPLPSSAKENLKLLARTEVVTVLGNAERNVRPYVNIGRWKYTSPNLASSYHLVGQK